MAPYVSASTAGASAGTAASTAPATAPAADGVTGELMVLLGWLGGLRAEAATVGDAERIDRIALLEQIKAAAAAAQAGEIVAFARSQVAAQEAATLDPRQVGRGIADQIGLACRVSPFEGSLRLGVARALHVDLPGCYDLFRAGQISERLAGLVVSETRHLDHATRRAVDQQLVAAGIGELSPRRAAVTARQLAYTADPHGFMERGRTERKHRRVGLQPKPDTMSLLTGYLPVEQGVACLAALRRHADTVVSGGDGRSRDQIMADTLVERLTGQTTAADVNLDINLVMPIDTLLDPDNPTPADLAGYGPIPAPLARDLITTSRGRRWWRRLFTAPRRPDGSTGPIVGGDPARRQFDGWLAQFLRLRDRTCRDPYCDAPIRHLDHIVPHRDGGPTTTANGRGVCARGNYVRELPGWTVQLIHDGLSGDGQRGNQPHTIAVTTPTGHTYTSAAPQPP